MGNSMWGSEWEKAERNLQSHNLRSEILGVRRENVVQIQFTETEEKTDAIKLKCKKQDIKSRLKVDGQDD